MTVGPAQSTGQFLLRSMAAALVILIEVLIREDKLTVRQVILGFLGGWLLALILCAIAKHLPWRTAERVFVLWFLLFIVRGLNLMLEWYFFSTEGLAATARSGVSTTLGSLALAIVVALLFPPLRVEGSLGRSMGALLAQHGWFSWAWRVVIGIVTYVFVYFVFGGIAFQFTKPYYTDPSYGLNLTLPSAGAVFKLQFVRGFTFLLASFFVLSGLKVSRLKQAWLMGLALFIPGGLAPLVAAEDWPVALRFYHTVEIFFQNFTTGVVLALLIGIVSSTQQHVSSGALTEKS